MRMYENIGFTNFFPKISWNQSTTYIHTLYCLCCSTLFSQKFRENNGFTKEITKQLIWRNFFLWERISRFSTLWAQCVGIMEIYFQHFLVIRKNSVKVMHFGTESESWFSTWSRSFTTLQRMKTLRDRGLNRLFSAAVDDFFFQSRVHFLIFHTVHVQVQRFHLKFTFAMFFEFFSWNHMKWRVEHFFSC